MEREGHPVILGIESSCDDTSAAVICGPNVLSNVVANQALHAEFGGVVPEWASRAHLSKIHPVVHAALAKAGIKLEEVDAVAYTLGPGLQGSLHVGASYAKALAWAANVPAIPVHHMRAHILAHVLEPGKPPAFPFLCLTVSGGHTQLVLVHSPGRMEVLGQTLDDAERCRQSGQIDWPALSRGLLDKLATEGNQRHFHSRVRKWTHTTGVSAIKQVLHFLTKQQRSDPTFAERHSRHLCFGAGCDFGHVDGAASEGSRGHRHCGGCHCRWGERQFRIAQAIGPSFGREGLDGAHPANGLLHGQRRHDCCGRMGRCN